MAWTIQHGGGSGADLSQAARIIWQSRLAQAQQPDFMSQLGAGIGQGFSRGVELGIQERQQQIQQQQRLAYQKKIEQIRQQGYGERERMRSGMQQLAEQDQATYQYITNSRPRFKDLAAKGQIAGHFITDFDAIESDLASLASDPNAAALDPMELMQQRRTLMYRQAEIMKQAMPKPESPVSQFLRETAPGGAIQKEAVAAGMDAELAATMYPEGEVFGRDRSGAWRSLTKPKGGGGKLISPGTPEYAPYAQMDLDPGTLIWHEDGKPPKFIKPPVKEDPTRETTPKDIQWARKEAIKNLQDRHPDDDYYFPREEAIQKEQRRIMGAPEAFQASFEREAALDSMGPIGGWLRTYAADARKRYGPTADVGQMLRDELAGASDPRWIQRLTMAVNAWDSLPSDAKPSLDDFGEAGELAASREHYVEGRRMANSSDTITVESSIESEIEQILAGPQSEKSKQRVEDLMAALEAYQKTR